MTPHDVRCMIDQQSIRYAAEVILEGPGLQIIPALEESELFDHSELVALQRELHEADWRAFRKSQRQQLEDHDTRRWLPYR